MKMSDEFYNFISELPEFTVSQETRLEDLENLEDDIYKINNCLSISLMKQLPYFKKASREVGILLINNTWFLIISSYTGIALPYKIHKYISNGAAQFCAHSHPYDGRFNNTNNPSILDLDLKAIDGLSYIISKEGFTEINISQLGPNDIEYIMEAESYYTGKRESNDYFLFMKKLYDKVGLNRKEIPYTDEKLITDIISSKYNLKTSFWDTDVSEHKAPFPGTRK